MRKPVCQRLFRDADLRGHGCTLASLTYGAREVSEGHAVEDVEAYTARLQSLSGVSLATFRDRGTTLTEAKVAYEQAPGFGSRVPPRLRLMRGGSVRGDILPELHAGRIAIVAVNYGVVQDAGKGIGSFRGGHAVVAGEPEDAHVTVADPLREELVRWRIDLLVRAMETFGRRPWGGGRGEAGIFLPTPTWLERRTEQLAAAREALARATAKTEAITAELRTTAGDLTAARARIRELEALPPADCATIAAERDAAQAAQRAAEAALNEETDRAVRAEAVIEAVRRAVAA